MNHFVEATGLTHYNLYMQDYGGPVGFRMILAHPERVERLIVQDAVAHNKGLASQLENPACVLGRPAATKTRCETNLLSLETTHSRQRRQRSKRERHNPDL